MYNQPLDYPTHLLCLDTYKPTHTYIGRVSVNSQTALFTLTKHLQESKFSM